MDDFDIIIIINVKKLHHNYKWYRKVVYNIGYNHNEFRK